jgi:hypothetical protein
MNGLMEFNALINLDKLFCSMKMITTVNFKMKNIKMSSYSESSNTFPLEVNCASSSNTSQSSLNVLKMYMEVWSQWAKMKKHKKSNPDRLFSE